jgi:hypothetical protein
MNLQKFIQRRIRLRKGGVDLSGDVNAVISANVGKPAQQAAAEPSNRTNERKESR